MVVKALQIDVSISRWTCLFLSFSFVFLNATVSPLAATVAFASESAFMFKMASINEFCSILIRLAVHFLLCVEAQFTQHQIVISAGLGVFFHNKIGINQSLQNVQDILNCILSTYPISFILCHQFIFKISIITSIKQIICNILPQARLYCYQDTMGDWE